MAVGSIKLKFLLSSAVCAQLLAAPAYAGGHADLESIVADNLVATLYHEFGHGVIALWDLPIYGRE